MIISKKRFQREIEKALNHGYEAGIRQGKIEAIFNEVSKNDIREAVGLNKIENTKEIIHNEKH